MKLIINICFTVLFFLMAIVGNSQVWVDEFTKPENRNFYKIQEAFNEEWKDRAVEKGKGYKQYKRWENYWETRVFEDGSFPDAGIVQQEWENYNRNQSKSRDALTANWTSLGPNSSNGGYAGIGRIASIAFDPIDTDKIYVGAAGGGFWKSDDGGDSWITTSDDNATLGVSGIVVDHSDANTIFIATGDGDGADNYSVGVLKSLDGGDTWNTTGLNWATSSGRLIRRLIQDSNDANTLIAATSNGIYRTTDGGVNWVQEITGNFYDLEPKLDASASTFYACKSSSIYVSTNNGDTWTSTTSFTGVNRTALATTAGNTSYVYALCSNSSGNGFNSFHRSTDSGNNFTQMSNSPNLLGWSSTGSDSGGQGWYDLIVEADPTSPNTVFVGGVNTWKSTDGGANWTIKSHWSGSGGNQAVHADKHVFEWQGNVLWEGNDGGVYKTTNGGDSWTHKSNGMVISQMYKLGVSQTDSKVICGLQDNGTKLKQTNDTWSDVIGGDGMECAIQPDNSNVMYGELYYGRIRRSTNGGSNWTSITPSGASGAWVTPFDVDVSNPTHIYMGFKYVVKSTNQGSSWDTISPVGLSGSSLSYLKVAPSDANYIYTGRHNVLYRTTDGGANWNTMTVPGNNVTMIVVHNTNPEILWATRSNYSSGNKVYKSINGGSSWTNVSGTLPNLPANCITLQNGTSNGLYVGMDIGIFYKDDEMSDWELFTDGLPNVEIRELEINYSENKIYAATYGRGLWVSEVNNEVPTCFVPKDLRIESVGAGIATVAWDDPIIIPNNYEWILNTTETAPLVAGTNLVGNSVNLTGMVYGTDYYCHVRSDCGGGDLSAWKTIGPIRTWASCGDDVFDSGGSGGEYSNNENYSITICPTSPSDKVDLTFNSFDVESTWDALYIHNGNSTSAPLISSGNPSTQAGFPAGGYYGTTIPGPFSSSDATGCITLKFLSDNYVTEGGWDIDVTCSLNCAGNMVTNINDAGYGSLRHLLGCLTAPDTEIGFDPSLAGQTIIINSAPFVIDKNVSLSTSLPNKLYLKSDLSEPMITIRPGFELYINNLDIISKFNARVITNSGTLKVKNSVFTGADEPIFNKSIIQVEEDGVWKIQE